MANTRSQVLDDTHVADIGLLRASFLRHLHAENKAPSTRTTYVKALDQFIAYLDERQMPRALGAIHREQVEAFLIDLQERGMPPATVSQRYRSLHQFFRWAAEEGEIPSARRGPRVNLPAVRSATWSSVRLTRPTDAQIGARPRPEGLAPGR
jgi:site-specific recombinase XerD